MSRYYVFGSCMECMFHIHCEATSEDDALRQWDQAFPNCSRDICWPKVYPGDPNEDLYVYESGGYIYESVSYNPFNK